MSEPNLDRNWDFNTDLSGLEAPTGKPTKPPTGYYKAKITDMYINQDNNANRVVIKLTVAEGKYTGCEITDGINKPKDGDDPVRYYWRAMAESVGFEPAALDNGSVKISPSTFKDKIAHVEFTAEAREYNGKKYDQTNYLAPVRWNQRSQLAESVSGSALGVNGATTVTQGSGDTTTKSSLMKDLNL